MGIAPLVIEFVEQTSLLRERPLVSDLPILRNGPPGTFVVFRGGWRVSLPTDQIVFAEEVDNRVRVGFDGMRFVGLTDGALAFHRVHELYPEDQLSPARSHTMRLAPDVVSRIHENGEVVWPGLDGPLVANRHQR